MTGMHGRVTAAWAAFLLAASITAGYAINQQRDRSWLATPVSMIAAIVAPDPERLFGKPAIRVLLVGLDYDYDAKDLESSKTSRSDIIMAANLDF